MPWVHRWWNQVIGFMHRLSNMPKDSIHAEVLRDNTADAQEHPSYGNWAGGIIKQYRRLGMASPFSSSGITCLNSLGFRANMKGQLCKVWDGLHVPLGSPQEQPPPKGQSMIADIQQTHIPSDESLEQGRNRSRELLFHTEQPDKPCWRSGRHYGSGTPPSPLHGFCAPVSCILCLSLSFQCPFPG